MNHSSSTLTEALLSDWLDEYANLEPPHLRSFATEQEHNDEVVIAIFNVLEERFIYSKLVEPVCDQLFAFYRSREPELQRFALQFVPSLIRVYLGCTANGDKQSCRAPEALLISMYNLEVIDTTGKPRDFSFRMPSIALSSIYHEPMSLAPSFLTEGALRRLEECNSKRVSWGPFPQVEALNAQNRLKVMTALMFVYNHHLNQMSRLALENVCKVVAKIVTQGFNKPGHHQRPSYGGSGTDITSGCGVLRSVTVSRIPLSSQFLLELLHASHNALHRGVGLDNLAARAIDDIYQRARHEAYADVQLLATAIRRSINTAHLHGSRPSVISVATAVAAQVSKSMITNASFRTKKLPDDIPIQLDKEDATDKNLMSITEEREEEITSGEKSRSRQNKETVTVTKSLPKLPTFSGLSKKLQKDKDTKFVVRNGGDNSKIAPAVSKDTGKNNRSSILGSVLNGESTENDFTSVTRKKSSVSEMLNGPLLHEIKNANSVVSNEVEKVSLISDSLHTNAENPENHLDVINEGTDVSNVAAETKVQSIEVVQLSHNRDENSRFTMQVSSV